MTGTKSVLAKLLVSAAILGGLLAVGWAARTRVQAQAAATAAPSGRGGGTSPDRIVPVMAIGAEKRDVPVYLEGIGNVAALKTVLLKSRVDGRLDRVAFKEGQRVRQGELLALIDARPFEIQLHLAEAQLARDTAQLRTARANLQRYDTVRKEKLIAEAQVDDQRGTVEQLEATLKADQAQIENAKLQIDYAHIASPIDGVTGVRLVDPGNIVHASDPSGIVLVTQLDPIAVLFTLPQDDLPRVAQEMARGQLTVDATSRDGSTVLGSGTVELIDNQINATTATIRLKAVLPNPKHVLWPNQFVKARLHLATRKDALVVPAAAVQRGPKGTFVYVVAQDKDKPDKTAEMRPVQVDSIEGETAVLAGGLRPGEQVVTEGQAQLRPGSRVSVGGSGGERRGAGGGGGGGRRRAGGAAL
jgi:multidrug efflux system membrane fusion protein